MSLPERSGIAAVFVDDPLPPWQHSVLEALGSAGLRLRISRAPSQRRVPGLVVRAYRRLDRWPSLTPGASGASAQADSEPLVGVDFAIDLTATRVSREIETPTPILFLEPRELDEEAVLVELTAGHRTLGLEVRVRSGDSEHRAAESVVALTRFSARRSAERIRERAATLMVRALERLRSGSGLEAAEPEVLLRRRSPSAAAVARLLGEAAAAAAMLRLTRVDWRVAYGTAVPGEPFTVPHALREVSPPPGRFYADPFLAHSAVGTFLFVEDFDLRLGRAAISVVDLSTGEARPAVSADHHLSYPFVFEADGTWYMLPETAEADEIVLLRCETFPDRWTRDTVLLDGVRAYDPTLLRHDGLWWLFFAAGTEDSRADDELHLWFGQSLHGPFAPHPANPVVSSVVGSSPAGRIVHAGGRLLRPGQDGSREYGGAIVVNEILSLTTTDYREQPFMSLGARELGALGIHTIDTAGDLVVIDTKHRVLRSLHRRR